MRFSLAVVATASLLLAGCSTDDRDGGANGSDTRSFVEQVSSAIAAAETGGASDAQLAILREAQANGELTFDQARQATLATIDCLERGGGTGEYSEQHEPSGLVIPMARALAKDEETLTRLGPVIEECANVESFWVNNVYQLQPESQDVRDAYVEKQAPVTQACLEDHGHATDPNATGQELRRQAILVSMETDGEIACYD